MSSLVVVDQCKCGRFQTGIDDKECACGKKVYSVGDLFAETEPEYEAVETITIDINKVMPFLKEHGIENFK